MAQTAANFQRKVQQRLSGRPVLVVGGMVGFLLLVYWLMLGRG